MKSKKLIFAIIIGLLIVPVLSMTVSLSHIEQLANISNYPWASWFLACGIEIGSIFLFLALLFKLSSDNHKALAWVAFFILSIVQLIGNTYAGFVHINKELASNPHYLDNLMEITFNSVDASLLKLIVSSIFGVLIVFLSLICMHFSLHLVEKFKNYHEEEDNGIDDEEDEDSDEEYPDDILYPNDHNDGINDGDVEPRSETEEEFAARMVRYADKIKSDLDKGYENQKLANHPSIDNAKVESIEEKDKTILDLISENTNWQNVSSKNYGDDGVGLTNEQLIDIQETSPNTDANVTPVKPKRKYTKKDKAYWGDDILPIVEDAVNVSQKTVDEAYTQKELTFEESVNKALNEVKVDNLVNNNNP